jgi:hypothetical protein
VSACPGESDERLGVRRGDARPSRPACSRRRRQREGPGTEGRKQVAQGLRYAMTVTDLQPSQRLCRYRHPVTLPVGELQLLAL